MEGAQSPLNLVKSNGGGDDAMSSTSVHSIQSTIQMIEVRTQQELASIKAEFQDAKDKLKWNSLRKMASRRAIKEDMYCYDLLTGAGTEVKAIRLREQSRN